MNELELLAKRLGALCQPERLWVLRFIAKARTANLQQIVEAKGFEWDSTSSPAHVYRKHLMALVEMGLVTFEREHDGKIPSNVFTFVESEWRSMCCQLLSLAGIAAPKEIRP